MRYALAGLTLLAATVATGTAAQAHDRHYYPRYAPYPPPVRYVVPAPRYYHPPPTYYYYAPAPVYAYPRHRHYDRYFHRHHRPYRHAPHGSATFFFKF